MLKRQQTFRQKILKVLEEPNHDLRKGVAVAKMGIAKHGLYIYGLTNGRLLMKLTVVDVVSQRCMVR